MFVSVAPGSSPRLDRTGQYAMSSFERTVRDFRISDIRRRLQRQNRFMQGH